MERLLNATEVMFLVGIAPKTLDRWYAFKRENPDHELSKQLPDFEQPAGFKTPRYWKESDIPQLMAFKDLVPKGRNGLFGNITHQNQYKKAKKEKEKNHDRKKIKCKNNKKGSRK